MMLAIKTCNTNKQVTNNMIAQGIIVHVKQLPLPLVLVFSYKEPPQKDKNLLWTATKEYYRSNFKFY